MLMLYLIEGIPAAAQFLIMRLQLLDIAIALRALRQHDGGVLFLIDVARREKRRRRAIHR